MGWRDVIAKALLGNNTGLTTDAYHGTKKLFDEFKPWKYNEAWSIDRALGTHAAKDPAIASEAFANPRGALPNQIPHVIPLKIPPEETFLQAHQPRFEHASKDRPEWRSIRTDTHAINTMATLEAISKDPDLLRTYLERNRAMPSDEARSVSRALIAGERPVIEGAPRELESFIANFGAPVGDDVNQKVVDLARQSWQDKGYSGIRYINTAPMEAGAPGVKDPTSYIVFDPADLRSRFAQFDPARMLDRNLMAGVAGASVIPAMGSIAAWDQYEERP